MPRISEVTPILEFKEIAQKLKQCPASFYYNLSAEALETCRKIAPYALLGEIYPPPITSADEDQLTKKIKEIDDLTEPYFNRTGIKGLKNWGIRRFHELLLFCKLFFLKISKKPDLSHALHEKFGKPLRNEDDLSDSKNPFDALPAEIVADIAGRVLDFDSFIVLQKNCGRYEYLFWKGLAERLTRSSVNLDLNNYKEAVMRHCRSLLNFDSSPVADQVDSPSTTLWKAIEKQILLVNKSKSLKIKTICQLQEGSLGLHCIWSWGLIAERVNSTSEGLLRVKAQSSKEIKKSFLQMLKNPEVLQNPRPIWLQNFGHRFLIKIFTSIKPTHVDLSYNKLTQFPDFLGEDTEVLILSHNFLKLLPPSCNHLSKITKLDLSHNKLKQVPDFLAELSTLTALDLSENETIGTLTSLKSFSLFGHRLTRLPQSFGKLKQLEHLHAAGVKPMEMPGYISTFTQLQNFIWYGKVCEGFGQGLTGLTALALGDGDLESAEFIGQNPRLAELMLSGNRLTTLPDISGFALNKIYLSHNKFKQLPNLPPGACVEAKHNEFSFFERWRILNKHPNAHL